MRRPTCPRECGELHPIGPIAAEVMENAAVRAVAYWFARADEADGEGRIACLETANAILRSAGLRRSDFVPRKAA